MDTAILIQARSGSTRFPGKVLKKIWRDVSLVNFVYMICEHTGIPTFVIVPYNDNDLIDHLCDSGTPFMCGDEKDVLSRYYTCSKALKANRIIRVTADCPFVRIGDILHVSNLLHQPEGFQYVSNIDVDGEDVEGFTFNALERAYANAAEEEREHVTTYMRRAENKYIKVRIRKMPKVLSVNTEEEFNEVKKIIKESDNG